MKRNFQQMSGRSASDAVELLDSQPNDPEWPIFIPDSPDSEDVCIIDHDHYSSDEILRRQVESVLEIFPDADERSIQTLFETRSFDQVVAYMAFEGYTKSPKADESCSSASSSSFISSIDFTSPSDQWVTADYKASVFAALEQSFPFLKLTDLKTLLVRNGGVYWKSFEDVMSVLQQVLPLQPYSDHAPTIYDIYTLWGNKKVLLSAALSNRDLHLKQTRPSMEKKSQGSTDHPVLQAELKWYKQVLRAKRQERDRKNEQERYDELAAIEGTLVECGCCFGEFAIENHIQCSEGHLFCKDCLIRHTEQTLYGNGKATLACMNTVGETCPGFFSDSTLSNALPAKVYAKFAEAQCRDVIKAAKLDNIIACHNCSLLAELPPDAGKVLSCPNCQKMTCRDCGDEAHIPLRCEEVEKKGQTSLRVRVEEALTKARVRECPKCHQKFYKSEGCNKMTCPCGMYICYICRENINKVMYAHFCQLPNCNHKTCNKCILYSDSAADDLLAMRDAGLKVIEAVSVHAPTATSVGSQNGNNAVVAADSINIDLDKYLEGVGASASARTNPVPRAMVAAVAAQPFFVPLELPPQPPLRGRGHNLIVPPRRQIRRQNKR